jgi:hypothetical protein
MLDRKTPRMDTDPVEQFAAAASAFDVWAREGAEQGEAGAREALLHIVRLYSCALRLPDPWSDTLSEEPEPDRISDEEVAAVAQHCTRLPLNCYGEVFDPMIVPPEEPVVGSLGDDIGDIFREVGGGLRAYQLGLRAEAIWVWGFGFRGHWGEHATGAIRALHAWLVENAMDKLHETI